VSFPSHRDTENEIHVEESGDFSKPHQILVADDDPSIVNLLRENFEEMGHHVLCAYDGQAAVRLAREHHPHLIILDINMPMTSGLKAFEFLRSGEDTSRTPVIFITGERSIDVIPALEKASRVAHVKKPFDLDSFNSLVLEFLQNYPID